MRTCRRAPDQSQQKCFRPVGVAFDTKGRLYMSSDSTGEVYVIERENGESVNDVSVATIEAIGG
jgi:hypothetical protein